MKTAAVILGAVILFLPSILPAQTHIDTVYSTPELDGSIGKDFTWNHTMAHNDGDDLVAGDLRSSLDSGLNLGKGYLSFDHSFLDAGQNVGKAIVNVFQIMSYGNSEEGKFPQWDIPGGDTLFCMMDHITYGDTLDTLDWTAGDPGDPQTLHSSIGVLSDNAVLEYKTLDVTEFVKEDIQAGRGRSQFRIQFNVQEPDDKLNDFLSFCSGDWPYREKQPFLAITTNSTQVDKKSNTAHTFHLFQNYPNPFNSETIIRYSLSKPGFVRLTIHDVQGRKIEELITARQPMGMHTVSFSSRNVSSGIYICRLSVDTKLQAARKITIIK